MKSAGWVRYAIAGVVLYALVRIAPTVDSMRGFMLGACYFLAGVCAIAVALSVLEYTTIDLGRKWRARVFDACGLMDFNGDPCMLPNGHHDHEHATAWVVVDRGTQPHDLIIEHRHRFDDVAAEGRVERRYGRGQLAKVMRGGDVPETAAK